jgi:protein-disulfide isomerase
MSKQFWIIVAVIVIVLVGVFAIKGSNNPGSNSSSSAPTQHIEGQGKSGVTLVEYGDYQCPFCGEYASTLTQVQSLYNTQIFFQFRNFPLTSLHQNAFAGARAAEAAGLMGKFWPMHDLLYSQNQEYYNSNGKIPTWIGASNPETVFEQDAASLGLNVQKFEQLYGSEQVNNLITADQAVGNKLGLDATPTFILDGNQVQVGNTVADFQTVINKAIASKAGSSQPATTSSTGTTTQSKQ